MNTMPDLLPDRAALIYQHYEQLYRLALLLAGDLNTAARLVERAFRALPLAPAHAEAELVRALLASAPRRPAMLPLDEERLAYAMLDRSGARELLGVLTELPSPARLAVGLHYLRGLSADEAAELLAHNDERRKTNDKGSRIRPSSFVLRHPSWMEAQGTAPGGSPVDGILTTFRVAAARALALVPDDVDDGALADLDRAADGRLPEAQAIALRGAVFDQPTLRAARDGILATRELLRRAIPVLFASAPPAGLVERLLKRGERRQRVALSRPLLLARAGLAVGVLALAAAIIVLPSWLRQAPVPVASRAPSAAELLDAAIHRFDRAPLDSGVLHERYFIGGGSRGQYLVERWYDYGPTHRLRVALTIVGPDGESGAPVMEIASDGDSLVQYRYMPGSVVHGQPIDAHVSQADAQSALAVLRAEPSLNPFTRGHPEDYTDIAPLYLAQARAAGATFLGQTSVLDRPAYLLAYQTDMQTAKLSQSQPSDQPARVILTLDAQTSALLEVAVVAEGVGESNADRPLRATAFEVLPEVGEDFWRLPTTTSVEQQAGLPSARIPEISSALAIGLDEALRRTQQTVFAPRQLPSTAMRALAVPIRDNGAEQVVLLYEGEFQSMMVRPLARAASDLPGSGEEHSVGEFRYRMLDFSDQRSSAAAVAYRAEAPDDALLIMLVDAYATDAEREQALGQIIGTLTPVTQQTLPELQRPFYDSSTAGGQS